jgi:hypothetical protein
MSLIEINGVSKTRVEWCQEYGIDTSTVSQRMKRLGLTLVEAITHVKPKAESTLKKEARKAKKLTDEPLAPIPGFKNYAVTEAGIVWNVKLRRPLVSSLSDTTPYARVNLKGEALYVHRLACMAWHGEPEEDLNVVDHIDMDYLNNHKDNLRWTDMKGNADNRKDTVWTLYGGEKVRLQDLLMSKGFMPRTTEYQRYRYRIHVMGLPADKVLEWI